MTSWPDQTCGSPGQKLKAAIQKRLGIVRLLPWPAVPARLRGPSGESFCHDCGP